MSTGKITAINKNGTWLSPKTGLTKYKLEYEVENSETHELDKGGCLSDTEESKHHVGQILEYEIKVNGNFKNIEFPTEKKTYAGKSNYTPKDPVEEAKRQLSINRQSSVKCATELVCNGKLNYDDLLIIAQRICDWTTGDAKAAKMTSPSNEPPF